MCLKQQRRHEVANTRRRAFKDMACTRGLTKRIHRAQTPGNLCGEGIGARTLMAMYVCRDRPRAVSSWVSHHMNQDQGLNTPQPGLRYLGQHEDYSIDAFGGVHDIDTGTSTPNLDA